MGCAQSQQKAATPLPTSASEKFESAMGEQNVLVVMTNGTNDPLKAELAVLTAFALRKNNHKATMLMMGEAGSVIDDDILRNCNGFGLPPMAKILDDDCMKDVEWLV